MTEERKTERRVNRPAGDRDSQDARLMAIVERSLRRVDERAREIMERHRRRLKQTEDADAQA